MTGCDRHLPNEYGDPIDIHKPGELPCEHVLEARREWIVDVIDMHLHRDDRDTARRVVEALTRNFHITPKDIPHE